MNAIQPTDRLTTRRAFLQKSLRLGGAAVFPLVVPAHVLGRGGMIFCNQP